MARKKRKTNSLQSLWYDYKSKTIVAPKPIQETKKDLAGKKGIIYARVSTDEQKTKWGWIAAQIIECERWAKENWVEIVHEPFYDEAISWTQEHRPNFDEAFELIKQANKNGTVKEIELFIVANTSRFSRNHDISRNYMKIKELEILWVSLVAVSSWWLVDLDDEMGFIQYNFSAMNDAIESMRWAKRVRNWISWKLKLWLRPFAAIPLWYRREVITQWAKEIKILKLDEELYPILKKWLEDFADWVLYTKQQLYDYFVEHWVKSNSKKNKSWELSGWFVGKILVPRKIYFWGGYIVYPDYGIDTPTLWQHPPVIDEATMYKLLERVSTYNSWFEKKKYDEDDDDYPLKRIVRCPLCDKAMSKWRSLSKTKAYHHYYWCNNKKCKMFKKSISRDEIHKAVKERLEEITPSKDIIALFDALFKEQWQSERWDEADIIKVKKKEIKDIENRMERISAMLDTITVESLFHKKEIERAELNEKKEQLEYEIADTSFTETQYQRAYNDAKMALFAPAYVREYWDIEMKQLIIRVCFNWVIYYWKDIGCQTPEVSSLYLYFKDISDKTNPATGDNNKNVKPLMLWIYNNRDIFARINRLCTLHHLKAVYDFL